MAEVYLASSAVPGFEGQTTIKEAIDAGFDGVQLYLDNRYRNKEYTNETMRLVSISRLGMLIHLPNQPTEEDLTSAKWIADNRPATVMVLHHGPATARPEIPGAIIGWENSVTGKHDPEHVLGTLDRSRKEKCPFIYDYGRSRQPGTEREHKEIIKFIKGVFALMDPKTDILHTANQLWWDKPFRECESSLARGIWTWSVNFLKKWPGVVVIENENLDMAIEGLEVLRNNQVSEFEGAF